MEYKKLLKALFFSVLATVGILALYYGFNLASVRIFPNSPVNFGFIPIFLLEILIIKKVGNTDALKNKKFWYGVYLGSVVLIFHAITSILSVVSSLNDGCTFKPANEILLFAAQMLIGAGVFEELLFRGIVFNVFDKYLGHKSPKAIWCTVCFSGIIFGLYHFMNWVQGQALIPTLLQIVTTTGFGILFGAIYVRSRNLWSLAFIHGVYDIMAFGPGRILNTTVSTATQSSGGESFNIIQIIPYIVQMVVYTLIAMFLLRKKKMQEIIDCDSDKSSLKIKV
ncbi:MAG: CPBP family intramembrane metalloprotease [Clostridia bacterium]|nr:CPBP family intramembrane metalloprotease [Clostridia bacterium]